VFKDKNIVVGITGGIAAYKSAELVSRLKKKGAQVYCIMTRSAQEFITPITLRTLSQNPVFTEMFAEPRLWNVEHIALADRADLFMVVPATANLIGKLCHGLADDLLTTTIMAGFRRAPVLIAPAMNVHMYENPVTQANVSRLRELGYYFVEPESGDLACGYQGRGRLADLDVILEKAEELLVPDKPLGGLNILVTAGPTRESIDPVRYITNHSTGKMGYALAKQARLLGANVTLVSGPTGLRPFAGVDCIRVNSAREMYEAVMKHYERSDIIIKAAAVADYRPKTQETAKIKKKDGDMLLDLERNPDILAELGKKKGARILIGFAAETQDILTYAAEKIKNKNLDFIVANDITRSGAGFAHDTNIITLLFPAGEVKKLPQMTKEEAALLILQEAVKIKKARSEV